MPDNPRVVETGTAIAEMQDEWITIRVNAALQASPVADVVASVIKEQLNSTMRERSLRPSELTDITETLLAAVNDPLVKGAAE